MRLEECRLPDGVLRPKGNGAIVDVQLWPTIVPVIDQQSGKTIMSAYVVFTRTKTINHEELEKYWNGIRATMKGHPIEVLVAYGKHEVLEGDPI